MKFRVQCIGILSLACVPSAVVTATLRRSRVTYTWVLLSGEERDALSRMGDRLGWDISDDTRVWHAQAVADLIGVTVFDAETGEPIDPACGEDPARPGSRRRPWLNAEHTWVLARGAEGARAWGHTASELHAGWLKANPRDDGSECQAPSWYAFTALRKLLLAAGLPDIKPKKDATS